MKKFTVISLGVYLLAIGVIALAAISCKSTSFPTPQETYKLVKADKIKVCRELVAPQLAPYDEGEWEQLDDLNLPFASIRTFIGGEHRVSFHLVTTNKLISLSEGTIYIGICFSETWSSLMYLMKVHQIVSGTPEEKKDDGNTH